MCQKDRAVEVETTALSREKMLVPEGDRREPSSGAKPPYHSINPLSSTKLQLIATAVSIPLSLIE